MNGNNAVVKWGLFLILVLIWGSSFELMKLGLFEKQSFTDASGATKIAFIPVLSAFQVAALRMFFAGLVILPLGYKAWKAIPNDKRNYAILSGVLGSFFPAFLFCLAEIKLDPSFAGALNSLTPIFVLIVGFWFFQLKATRYQVIGIIISFLGSIALFFSKSGKTGDLLYVGYIIIATILYGLNVNMVGKKLKEVPSLKIAALAFSFLTVPSLIILLATNTHHLDFSSAKYIKSISAGAVLGILGTTIASVLFYMLMKKAGGVFASGVTYGIPFVAMFWDILNGYHMNVWVWLSLLVILCGIFITNFNKAKPKITH
jgi:drug/metabolite transporter (DMT)-like permease